MITVGEEYGGIAYTPIVLAVAEDAAVSEVMYCPGCQDLFIQIDVEDMSVGDTLVFTVEGSLDGITYDNLSATDATITFTADGTTLITFADSAPPYVRVAVVDTLIAGSIAGYDIKAAFGVIAG